MTSAEPRQPIHRAHPWHVAAYGSRLDAVRPAIVAEHREALLLIVSILLAVVSLVYATVGQAGGTAFLAVMAVMGSPAAELRPTALILTVVAAGYATWRLHAAEAVDWRMLALVGIPALPASFLGGLVALEGGLYYTLTGCILLAAAVAMVTRWGVRPTTSPGAMAAAPLGALSGFASGLTGVGGGVFLAPALIALGWTTARQAAGISAPFILGNSISGLVGVLLAGQRPSADTGSSALAALTGAVAGTIIGHRFMSERATRYVLAAILLVAGSRLLTR